MALKAECLDFVCELQASGVCNNPDCLVCVLRCCLGCQKSVKCRRADLDEVGLFDEEVDQNIF